MLSKADINWLEHLSNSQKVKIIPYDPKVKEIFDKQKREILNILEQEVEVLHSGASGMGISGQDEIDLVILVPLGLFDETTAKLQKAYGPPDSFYANQRAKFNRQQGDKKIEVFIINQDSEERKRSKTFEDYLTKHPQSLEAYRKLKEASDGIGIKEYYRRKMEFINDIIDKAFSD